MLAALAGCGDAQRAFGDAELAAARAAAARVEPNLAWALLERVYAARAHAGEEERPADACGFAPRCLYNRASTRALLREHLLTSALPRQSTLGEQRREDGGVATHNLWIDLVGTSRPDEIVLATAHYDAWFGGANDNASGVAVTLAAAHALAPLPLDRSVRFLFLDGEELGMVGAGRYLDEHGARGLELVLNADMVAFVGDGGNPLTADDEAEYFVQANERAAEHAHRFARLARALPDIVGVRPLVFPDDGVSLAGVLSGAALSDHAPFWLAGVPALFPFPVGDKPSWYHTPGDTPEHVDRDRLARVARLWAAALAAFATAP